MASSGTAARPSVSHEAVAVLFVAAMVGALHVAGFAGVRLDDAYITYRYGENIARGRGFVFNPGQHILGTTSPGHALLAALAHRVVGHEALPSVMSSIGALAWTAQALLAYAIVRRFVGVRTAVATSLGIAAGAAGSYVFVPLETNLVAALALGAILLALARRWRWAGLALGAATLMRPDALLLGVPLLSEMARDRGGLRNRARSAVVPALMVSSLPLAWAAFARAAFGSALPQTLGAKVHASSVVAYALHVAAAPAEPLAPHSRHPIALGLLVWSMACVGWTIAVRRDRSLAVFPAWAALHLAAYTFVLRPDVAFGWHLYPATLVAVLGALVLVGAYIERAPAAWSVAAIVIVVCFAAFNTIVFSVEFPDRFWFGARDSVYRAAAAYLRTRARPGDVADSQEVGTIAYYSDIAMIDHAGLVTPSDLSAQPGPDLVERHCRALGALPHLRFLILNFHEVRAHACLAGERPLTVLERPALENPWRLWIVDLEDTGSP